MLGEETVLLKALEGKRGQPEQRPPHPAERGLWDAPTVVHNVQTLAAVGWIIRNGADAFLKTGSKKSPGTVLVQVRTPSGDGIAEVPLGTPLRKVVALGGALPAGRSIKAVLVGGPSGGLLPDAALDTALRLRAAPRGRRPHRLGLGRRRRRSRVRRRPGPSADRVLCERGVRQDDPVPDRHATARGDRRPRRRRSAAAHRRRAHDRPLGRHRRLGAVRPRAPDDLPAGKRDAILPVGTGRALLNSSCPAGVCHPIAVAVGSGR